ncbi:hypothetical protein Poli38472_002174 [Pythium oligandrum]|uniref:Uncharacterized protein n=1 Tax=Pythium oligandrum TaxID=41045 RepID=A0A8K1CIT1_PYTOL|nr:hypothetical protein Poli38472_002174 [Pythium oligandrum]|eukprot:TMW63233.1 hypothetical protein Poli38472_002174 [Pythium oligandrum]
MASSVQRSEIPNDHVPLAFLLGRHANAYSLPSLSRAKSTPAFSSSRHTNQQKPVFIETQHVRQRERQAREYLEQVLNPAASPEKEAEAIVITDVERRHRTQALHTLLHEKEEFERGNEQEVPTSSRRAAIQADNREDYALFHGYQQDPGFLTIDGANARIASVSSVHELLENEKKKQKTLLERRRRHRQELQTQLRVQQATTKATLKEMEKMPKKVVPEEVTRSIKHRQTVVNALKAQQEEALRKAREQEKQEVAERYVLIHESKQRDLETRKAREVAHQVEKRAFAKIKGVGPSFVATLRVEHGEDDTGADRTNQLSNQGDLGADLPLQTGRRLRNGDSDEEDSIACHLKDRQHAVFVESQDVSLHRGGGFAARPKPRHTENRVARDDREEITTVASAVSLVKTRRDVLTEWKTHLVRE